MKPATIVEVKEKYSGARQTFTCDLLALSDDEAVVIYTLTGARRLHGIDLVAGDITVGYFWPSRPYNVYHFLGSNGQTRAFYINISDRTTISNGEIYWRDLIVDVLITPDGHSRVLDEDELPADMAPGLRSYIDDTRRHLLRNSEVLQKQWARRTASLVGPSLSDTHF